MSKEQLYWKLKGFNWRKVFRFQAVAWMGTGVNMLVIWLLHGQLHVKLLIAGAIAIEVAIIHNFSWNYFETWKVRVNHTLENYFRLLLRYNIVTASIDFVLNLGTLWLLNHFFGMHYLLANLIGQLLGPFFKFIANEFFIFPKKESI
ncbi:MAG: GtrA family protein [Candidatus Cloacimonadaceae bacterium]